MFRWVIGRMGCVAGKHARSRERAQQVGDSEQYTSVCNYCGVPMRRLAKRSWVVDKGA